MKERTRDQKATRRARLLALVVLSGIFSAYARAARASQLNTGSPSLGSGAMAVSACQSAPLSLGFVPVYDATSATDEVGSVLVRGLDTAPGGCGSKEYSITLAGGPNGAVLTEVQGSTPPAGDRFSVDVSAEHVPAGSVTSVGLVISG